VSAGLRAVIARCLEKEPERRYQHAGEVRAALEAISSSAAVAPALRPARNGKHPKPKPPGPLEPWQIAAIAIGVVVVAALIVNKVIPVPPDKPAQSLAVLPLENLSHDPEQAYFADGMTEEISTRLAQIAALRVIAQTSVLDLVRKHRSLPDIGRALRVPVLLRGSVLLAAGRVRITVQLVRASTGDLIWAQSYERNLLDVLALQSEVALAIARQIQVKLTPQEHTRLATSRQIDPEAYQAYLKGRAAWSGWTLEAYQEAERQFRHAIDLAPDYAPAWSGLADSFYGLSNTYAPPNNVIPRAREAAARALALDSTVAEAHTSIGIIKMVFDWDWAGAEQEFDRAIALKPGDANAHLNRGRLLVATGRSDDGLADIRMARDLDPLNPFVSAQLAWFLYYARRHEQALAQLRQAMSADPQYGMFHFMHGLMLEQTGDHAGAVTALEKAMEVDANPESVAQLSHAYATAGRRADAERMLARLMQMKAQRFVPAGDVAYAYAGLGEKDKAFQQLDSALVDHSEILTLVRVDPGFDPLRSDPRFDGVLRRVGLAR
jgi:eukaryotic-like serine/threonine-protein kinase